METRFQIPDGFDNPAGPSAIPSPQLQKSLEEAGRKVERTPRDVQAWIDLGNLYWQSGQAGYTVQCFKEALRLQPDLPLLKDWLSHYEETHSIGR